MKNCVFNSAKCQPMPRPSIRETLLLWPTLFQLPHHFVNLKLYFHHQHPALANTHLSSYDFDFDFIIEMFLDKTRFQKDNNLGIRA